LRLDRQESAPDFLIMVRVRIAFFFVLTIATHQNRMHNAHGEKVNDEQSCSWEDRETCSDGNGYRDPNLVPMLVDFGKHQDNVLVYVTPDVSTFYNETPGTRSKKETTFKGQFGKFINMSNKPVRVFWISQSGQKHYIADLSPFGAAGTATYPDHEFVVTEQRDPDKELTKWIMEEFNSLYKYDPYGSLEKAQTELTSDEFQLYALQRENLAFDKMYRYKTGRQWLALYGRKQAPKFPMWPAEAFGQKFQIVTNETHFISQPPDDLATEPLSSIPTPKDHSLRSQFRPFRSSEETLTLNM
jgi:hypothetical protein